ncbi:MAG: type II secretion system protein GspN [Proteobacteria bacterium]|nr:type II secretion system protein GspN [Pseudomonadota bacterium]MBU1650272.1 type II secretion system protein GspN [Pseudomonadota bacterium]
MTFFPNTFWRWSLYTIYGLLLVMLLLYLRFPAQKFKTFCTHLITLQLPNYENSIESLHYRFPLTLVARNIHLQSKEKAAKEVFEIEQLTISPDLKAPGKNFSLAITAYGGTHQIALVLDRTHNTFTLPNIKINGLDLAKLPLLQAQTGRAITGLFTAQGSYSGQTGQEISLGSGQGSAHIENGTFELLYPILSLNNIAIEKGEVLFKLESQKIVLSKGTFNGKELRGIFSGQMTSLNTSFATIQLKLTGTLTPLPSLVKQSGQTQPLLLQLQQNHTALPFHLEGTIAKPAFLFDS